MGRRRPRHAGDAEGNGVEKGAAVTSSGRTQHRCVACGTFASRAKPQGISAKQRGAKLRDGKREGRTPKYAGRQAGCQAGGCRGTRGVRAHRCWPTGPREVGPELQGWRWGRNDGKNWKRPADAKTGGSMAVIFQDLRTL